MKIGIITLPLHSNYGGILQAYALQTILERMGHEVYIIEKKKFPLSLPLYKMPFSYGKRIIKNLIGCKCSIFYEQKYNRQQSLIRLNTDRFISSYIHLVQYDDFSDIEESEYDAIVVGSDQVWRPRYFEVNHSSIEDAYLKFAEDWKIKRIAYAVSFGTDEWEYSFQQTFDCSRLLKKFEQVSVRESSGAELCHKYFGINVEQVLDPTLLIKKEDYIQLFEKNKVSESKGNLLVYILDEIPEKSELINKIAEEKKLIPFKVNSKVGKGGLSLPEYIQPTVEEWIRGFYDAEFVVTDSFHACVFSILFNKPFIVYGNENRGLSRFTSVLNIFGLEERLLKNLSEYRQFDEIDWNRVNSLLEKKIKDSCKFLYKLGD